MWNDMVLILKSRMLLFWSILREINLLWCMHLWQKEKEKYLREISIWPSEDFVGFHWCGEQESKRAELCLQTMEHTSTCELWQKKDVEYTTASVFMRISLKSALKTEWFILNGAQCTNCKPQNTTEPHICCIGTSLQKYQKLFFVVLHPLQEWEDDTLMWSGNFFLLSLWQRQHKILCL